MPYNRTLWENNKTPLNADNMNNIEEGIVEVKEEAANAKTSANNALTRANQALQQSQSVSTQVATAIEKAKQEATEQSNQYTDAKIKKLIDEGGIGGGGSNKITVNTITPLIQTIAANTTANILVNINFTTGDTGVAYVYGNDVLKNVVDITKGENSIDVTEIISTNETVIKIVFMDSTGASTSLTYLIKTIELKLTSPFDDVKVYEGPVDFRYIPYGNIEKQICFNLDGVDLEPDTILESGEIVVKTFNDLTHGVHKLIVNMKATIDDNEIHSNSLEYNILVTEEGNDTILLSSKFNKTKAVQGELLSIDYIVYNPAAQTTNITLKINNEIVNTISVGRTRQYWNLTEYPEGELLLSIELSEQAKLNFVINVEKSNINITPVNTSLELYLNAKNRSNNEKAEDIIKWSYENFECTLRNFNFSTNGWMSDDKGNPILRINGEAQVEIPFNIFATDFLNKGKTIEFDFSTTDIYDINKVLVNCFDTIKGFKITSNDCILKSELTTVETKFKEDERVRVSFVIEPTSSYRLVKTYLNGILSGLAQYPSNDDFTQNKPVGITINPEKNGSIDIYSIRIYNMDLTNKQILNNYIADLSLSDRAKSFSRNDILDDYGRVSYTKIKSLIPVLTITGSLPGIKGDKKKVIAMYKNPFNSTYDFEFEDVTIDIQGTSSQFYPRKNYKLEFKDSFSFYEGAVPEKTYTFKADYMESSHSHNTGNAKIMNLLSPKFPTQTSDNGVRNAINGFPVAIFVQKDVNSTAEYYGIFNFNNDKGNINTIGLTTEAAESWEFKNNTSAICLFRSDNFTTNLSSDFEARCPKGSTNYTNLSRVVSWVYSTENNLDKFKNQFHEYFNKDFCLFYYIMMDVLLAVDSRAKNMFLDTLDGQIWYPRWYDIDTAYGLNNEGVNQFSYGLEQHDSIENVTVYNGENSLFWNNFEQAFEEDIKNAYKDYRSNKNLNYETIYNILYNEQVSKISENMYNTDGQFKYVGPLIENNDSTYLYVEQGNRLNHLQWWLSNRFKYLDSKYEYSDFKDDFISMRTYTPDTYVVAPTNYFDLKYFNDGYAQVLFGSSNVRERTTANEVVRVTAPEGLTFNNTETIIYGASKILDIGDVSTKYARTMDFSKATKLKRLQIGNNTSGYLNTNLEALTIGNNTMLEYLNIENCSKLTQAIDLTGCLNVKEVYAKGSSVTAVNFANGGNLKTLELPSTVTNLSLVNQPFLSRFVMDDYSNVSTLRIENTPLINSKQILNFSKNIERVRITNVDWQLYDSELHILNNLLNIRGLNEEGGNLDKAVLTGKVHVKGTIGTGSLEKWNNYFGNDLIITADEIKPSYTVTFVNWDGTVLYETDVIEGGTAVYEGETPTKPDSEEGYKYTFNNWNKTLTNITSDIIITAIFSNNKPTIITLNLTDENFLQPTFYVWYINGLATIDWGDGSIETYTLNENSQTSCLKSTPYSSLGVYTIKALIEPATPPTKGNRSIGISKDYYSNYAKFVVNLDFQSGMLACLHTNALGYYNDQNIILEYLKLPSSLKEIGYNVTYYKRIKEVYYEGTLLDFFNIYSRSGLKPEKLYVLNDDNDYYLVESNLIIPDGVTKIHEAVCAKWDWLTNVVIPEGVTSIENTAFSGCTNLTSIEISSSVTSIGNSAFSGCTNLTSIEIPEGVASIGNYAFTECTSLESIEIPESVARIGNTAFRDCKNLKSLIMLGEVPPTIESNTLDSTKLNVIEVPTVKAYEAYTQATNWIKYASIITTDDVGILSIGNQILTLDRLQSKNIQLSYLGSNPTFNAQSDNTNICVPSVNNDILTITAISAGTTNITVSMIINNKTFTQTFSVTVLEITPEYTYSVETVEGATYGFTLNDNGYYESTNKGKSSSCALCKVTFMSDGIQNLYLDCINSGESSCDYGTLSVVDRTLSNSTSDDADAYKNFRGASSYNIQTVNYGVLTLGEHFIYIKFKKDGSSDKDNDSLQFKVRIE